MGWQDPTYEYVHHGTSVRDAVSIGHTLVVSGILGRDAYDTYRM